MIKTNISNFLFKTVTKTLLFLLLFQTNGTALPKNTAIKNIKWKESSIGMYGGVVKTIIQSPDKKYLFAGTYQTGIYRTEEESNNWIPFNNGLENLYINDLIYDENSLIAATNSGIYFLNNNDRWEKPVDNIESNFVYDLEISLVAGNKVLFAAADQGIYKTKSYNANWEKIELNINFQPKVLSVDPSDNNKLLASGRNNILLKTEDQGLTWMRANQLDQLGEFESLSIDIKRQNVIYGGTLDRGFFVSENFGSSWQNKSRGLKNLYVNKILPSFSEDKIYLSTFDGIYQGKPLEEDWIKVGEATLNDQFISLCKINDNTLVVGTNGNGVLFYSFTEKQWNEKSNGISNVNIRTLIYEPFNEYIIAGTWGAGIFKSLDEGKSWQPFNKGLKNPYVISAAITVNHKLFVGTYNGGLYRLEDDGITWNHIDTLTLSNYYIFSIATHPSKGEIIYVGTANGIYKTIDEGKTWVRLNLGSEDYPVGEIMDIQIDPNDMNYIIAGSSTKGIFISKDTGETWFESNLGIRNNHILSIAIEPKTKMIYAGTFGSGIFISEDMGASWQQSNAGINNLMVYNILIDLFNVSHVILSTETGIFISLTKGHDWELFGDGLEFDSIRKVIYLPSDERFICATYGKGIYKAIHFPSSPIPMEPMNETNIIRRNPMFRWTESSDSDVSFSYHLQIAKDLKFTQIVFENSNISGDQFQVPDLILERYQQYFWHIRTKTALGSTVWSKVYSFFIVTMMILKINSPLIIINGKEQEIEDGKAVFPVIVSGRTFLPIRVIIENLGGKILYDPLYKKITIELNQNKLELQIGNPIATVNGLEKYIETNQKSIVPFVKSGRTFLPLRFVAENINASVEWNAKNEIITLVYPERKR